MTKFILIYMTTLSMAMAGCVPIIPDLFSPFVQGMEAANRENWNDRTRWMISDDINYFIETGDYRALCHAAMLGSVRSAAVLREDGIGCQIYTSGGRKYIRTVVL
jgi:hypothetical protein